MRTEFRSNISYILLILGLVVLIALAVFVPAISSGQPAETQTSTNLSGESAMPVKVRDAELKTDYKIPSEKEIMETKKLIMDSSEYKDKEAKLGKDQAENDLNQKLKDDLDYMIEQNKKGSVKIQAMCIGDDEGCLTIPPEHRP